MNYAKLKTKLPELLDALRGVIYPEVFGPSDGASEAAAELRARALLAELLPEVASMPRRAGTPSLTAKETADALMARMPAVRALLETDLVAAYEGDPAATCREEIIMAYPAFEAISVFRVAHELYALGVPMLPRMMTEYAHSRTGIDIHPGATIGEYFFIDHGTGVVIGETTVIGDHVKLYHGVTLGAKSFEVNPDGSLVKGVKRHPNIGSRVVIYAGATILGGDTTIGDGCVIGGNVWLTHSVPAGKTVIAAHERVAEEESPKPASPQTSVDVFM
ncbi:MAG: serine acetyltransferase [Clostridia bacterium]|nr:serine acetyltransferase [Clostridia bacterium]